MTAGVAVTGGQEVVVDRGQVVSLVTIKRGGSGSDFDGLADFLRR